MDGNIRLDPTFQGYFDSLKVNNEAKRIESTQRLLVYISKDEKNKQPVEYCLSRLIRGLSSNKQQTRVGFATALTSILRKCAHIKIENIIAIIQENLKPDPKKDSRKEFSQKLLGQLLVYISIIQSDRITETSQTELVDIVQKLKFIAKKKPPLESIVTQTLNQLISKVSDEQFRGIVEELKEELTKGWGKCDADSLSLMLTARSVHKDVIDSQYLKQHWGSKKLLPEGNYPKVAAIVEGSVKCHPLIHPVCEQLLRYDAKKMFELWKVFENALLAPDARKSYLLMALVPIVLAQCTSAEQVSTVMSPRLIAMLLKQGAGGKEAILAKAVQKMCRDVEVVCERASEEVQMAVLTSLIAVDGGLQFDQRIHVNTTTKIVSSLTPDAAQRFAKYALSILNGKTKLPYLEEDSPAAARWACRYLPACLCRLPGDMATQLHVMRFLLLHGFFSCTGADKAIEHCDGEFKRPESMRELMRQTYHTALTKVAVAGKAERTRSKKHFIEILYQLVQYAQSLLNSSVATMDTKWDDNIQESWTRTIALIEKIQGEEQTKSREAFQLLLLHLVLNLLDNPGWLVDCLLDVQVCYVKAHKEEKASPKKKKRKVVEEEEDEEEGEPGWMEVLVELLLSLLAHESNLLRTIVESVFRLLNDSLTPATVTLLVEAIQSSGDDENLAFEDSDEDKDDSDDSDDDEEDSDDDDDDDEDSDDDKEEEDMETDTKATEVTEVTKVTKVTKGTKEKVDSNTSKAKKDSDDSSDENSDSDDDLGDEEMFKMDGQLAAAFKAMSGKKDDQRKKQELAVFKIRVLSLIADIDHTVVDPSVALVLLQPLIEIVEDAMRKRDMGEVQGKATQAFLNVCKIKASATRPVSMEDTLEQLKEMAELPAKLFAKQNIQKVANASLCLIRILLGSAGLSITDLLSKPQDKGAVGKVISFLKDQVSKFSEKDRGKVSMLLITLVKIHPEILWPVFEDMLQLAGDEKTKVFSKSKLLEIMTIALNKKMNALVGKETVTETGIKISALVKQLLAWQGGLEQPNSKLVENTLLLTFQAICLVDKEVGQMHFNLATELATIRPKLSCASVRKQCNRVATLLITKCGLKVQLPKQPGPQKKAPEKRVAEPEGDDDGEEQQPPAKKKRVAPEEATEEAKDSSSSEQEDEEKMEVEDSAEAKEGKKDGQKQGLPSEKRKKRAERKRKKKAQQMEVEVMNGIAEESGDQKEENGSEKKVKKEKKKKSADESKENADDSTQNGGEKKVKKEKKKKSAEKTENADEITQNGSEKKVKKEKKKKKADEKIENAEITQNGSEKKVKKDKKKKKANGVMDDVQQA